MSNKIAFSTYTQDTTMCQFLSKIMTELPSWNEIYILQGKKYDGSLQLHRDSSSNKFNTIF
jgi:hypothetical protein